MHPLLPEERAQLAALARRIAALRSHARSVEERFSHLVREVHPSFARSARNLLHYLALRSFDLRELQEHLATLGLSSLGRTESHTLASLDAVHQALMRVLGEPRAPSPDVVGFQEGQRLVDRNTAALLGPCSSEERQTRIMVTLPSEAATDPELVDALVRAGMDVARINCAHDDAAAWRRMASSVRRAAEEQGQVCRVQLDLAGPKLRTGRLEAGPRVIRWRPTRDLRGNVTHPARLWLAPADLPPAGEDLVNAWIPVEPGWLERTRPGDKIRVRDASGRKRRLKVVDARGAGRLAECRRGAYLESGAELCLAKGPPGRVAELPPREQAIVLRAGDPLLVYAGEEPGRPARRGKDGERKPARIPCTLPEALREVEPGHRMSFDDGRIEGVVRSVRSPGKVLVEITKARPCGSLLRADKGINLPDTRLDLAGLTEKDRQDLDAVVELADMVGMSFVNTPEDVFALQRELARRGKEELGIVLKIETQRAIEELPWLLLAAMRSASAGVLIARGDLAVECGWERLAELQEEILWFCESAHLPVVWATQVLESLAQRGTPSRAEITDAAMAHRAECVMLNKGPHIVEAMATLDNILVRMEAHQHKKTPRLSKLGIYAGAVEAVDLEGEP